VLQAGWPCWHAEALDDKEGAAIWFRALPRWREGRGRGRGTSSQQWFEDQLRSHWIISCTRTAHTRGPIRDSAMLEDRTNSSCPHRSYTVHFWLSVARYDCPLLLTAGSRTKSAPESRERGWRVHHCCNAAAPLLLRSTEGAGSVPPGTRCGRGRAWPSPTRVTKLENLKGEVWFLHRWKDGKFCKANTE